MTQQEFDNIHSAIRKRLTAIAREFCKAVSVDLDAEDIVQEALVALWELSEKDYPIRKPEALLVTITKNICISRYRKRKLETSTLSGEDYSGGEPATRRTDSLDDEKIKRMLYECLTKTEREYMLLKTDEELTLDEIAQRTGKPKSGIKTALSKARKKLKEQMKKTEL